MLRIRKVLFPTDFSSCSHQALFRAVRIARDYRAELHVLHAVVLFGEEPNNPELELPDLAQVRGLLEQLAEERMGSLVREGNLPDLVLKLVQRRDVSPAPPILSYAQEEDIDLIVMGTHGRRGVRKWLLGSVTNEVVRFAPCPVLTVRGKGESTPPEGLRRILAPLDFSDHGKEAVRVACALASSYGAELDVVHVLPEGLHPAFYTEWASKLSDLQPKILERVHRALEEVLEETPLCQKPGVQTHGLEGHPGREILRFARDRDVDLIVICTHGLSGIKHFLLGSTTEQVMAGADCPVLVTKADGKTLLE